MFYSSIPENVQSLDIASVYVIDNEGDNYTCTVNTDEAPIDKQPFEIVDNILRTSLNIQDKRKLLFSKKKRVNQRILRQTFLFSL